MLARVSPVGALAAAALCAACAGPGGPLGPCGASADPCAPGGDSAGVAGGLAADEGRYGLLLMTHDRGEPGVAVSGQFASFAGRDQAFVLHALALPEVAWLVSGLPEAGGCRAVSAPREPWADGGDAHLELMGAGELTVRPPSPEAAPLRLTPREFPRVFFSLGGLVYDADAQEALPYRPNGLYRITAPGDEIGPLAAQIRAPEPVTLGAPLLTPAGLWVRWDGPEDAVVTLSREASGETTGLQCRAAGGERFLVPAALLEAFGGGDAQLTVGAIGHRPVDVPGLTRLDLIFVSRDSAVVRLPAGPAHE